MPPPVDPKVIKQERDALAKVVVKKFGANPRSVPSFGTTTISWDVTIPDSPVDISIELDGGSVPPTGSRSFALIQNRTFRLAAKAEHTGRALRSTAVTVDLSACQTKLLPGLVITGTIERGLKETFGKSTKLKLKDHGVKAVLSEGAISIGMRTVINVPDWFDADMNVSIQLAVLAGKENSTKKDSPTVIKVTSTGLFVNIKWGFFEHLASLFCTGFVQSGMEQLAREFLAHIVEAELAAGIASSLNEQRIEFVEGLKEADAQKREFAMTLVKVNADGISLTACPK